MQEYEDELRSERSYVTGLYTRLDGERARAREKYAAALRGDGALVERDAEVRALANEIQRLDVADDGLCFGRLDADSGERLYIGRIGLFDRDDDFEPLLLDWRAPLARAFYVATAAHPEGMRRRRQFHTRGRRVLDFTDEVLGRPRGDERGGESALLAAVNAPRGEGMRDIVATIQAEQDAIIRLDHSGVLVIEGGPGTGKTVVALHRVAYLLYTQRARIERHGVLVIGPNPAFLDHISRVLPSLGETNVVLMTTGDLVPGLSVTAEDGAEAVALKGSLEILDVLAAAVADRERVPERPLVIELPDVTVQIDPDTAQWAIDEARGSGLPHNHARRVFRDTVEYVLTERAVSRIGRGWLSRADKGAWEELRADVLEDLADSEQYLAALDQLWPSLTPQQLLSELYESRERLQAAGADERLWRSDGAAWTVSDVPLLDELVDLLGRDTAADIAAEKARVAETDYAEGVLESMVAHEDLMDDEDLLLATDLMRGEELAERFTERDNRELAERAAADRDWTYRHVVVDEAQELSEMDWRVLMRRCPSKSFTIVGDLAQRRSPAGARSWSEMLEPYVPGRWLYRPLSVNYRTPAEIMAVAAAVLAEFAPAVTPPESVRSTGVPPWRRLVAPDEIASAIADFMQEEDARDGTCVVIGPPDVPGTVAPADVKGLEFDAVLLVEPERIFDGPRGAADLYVALTRATQRLAIAHCGPLPPALAGLTEHRVDREAAS
ncbi:helicase [Mycobacterium sp. IS-1742]|uniref:RNA polymerase recycling motor ATPase HelR n=1 Tax=Mycobacterium sp. IS-1742 TaxID=1772285 RepID=UPI0007401FC7|nr:RNA polymerase recycling motor ATPase HelR [Mycobacterium sp. IS-1742]KUI28894.1 helicase [Mycobacterium sp. IS-1742]